MHVEKGRADVSGRLPGEHSSEENLEQWEQEAIQSVAASFDTLEREDLAAELAWRLLVLKRQRGTHIRNWRAYVYRFLRNKALNWIRKNRPRERNTISIDTPMEAHSEHAHTLADLLPSSDADTADGIALETALDALPQDLRNLLSILVEENWNQLAVSKRLHKHRNTVRAWIGKLRQALATAGLDTRPDAGKAEAKRRVAEVPSQMSTRRQRNVTIAGPIIETLTKARISGMQWRLVLWIILQCSRRKQRAVPFSWRAISRALAVDHGGLIRLGRALIGSGVLFVEQRRIGIERGSRSWRLAPPERRRSPSRVGDNRHRFRGHQRRGDCAPKIAMVPPSGMTPPRSIRIPTTLLDALLRQTLSGTQWSIVFWIMRGVMVVEQKTTRFSWYRVAAELGIDRGGVVRSGRDLIRAEILRLVGGKMAVAGFQLSPGTPKPV
jgi:RNA polymerase sigma factor (sigma-70 family)